MALIGQMTAVLAHEIRNAIGSIKGYPKWVDEKTGADDPTKKGLALVLSGTERIESLVNELLLFSREETYIIENIALSPIITSVLSFLPPWEGKINVSIETEVSVKADKEKLQRVLLNGIQNAIQAMGHNGVLLISARNDKRWGKVVIKDIGHGIQKSAQHLLFTPFYTTKTSGTGLGLSYSKKVVEGMGGRIDLYNSEDGSGAVLVICLPKA